MHSWTQIDLAGPTISIPMLPDRFMTFSCVATLTNRQLADVIGIVVYVSPVRFLPSTNRNTPCREVVLMNNRWEFICLRIWDKHVSRHMMKWRRAEQDMSILSAILFEVSTAQWALKSTDNNSQLVFDPDTLLAYYDLASFRQTLRPAYNVSTLKRVRAFVRQRLKMGLYVNLRIWKGFKSGRLALVDSNMSLGAL
ncbi:uncharacterized protein [Lolium perenne]|uniref:uncharacterized protein n=1 Tax=Lolium perenne TaxID=4522 RepID=UPI0021F5AA4C|nr:uncharacterized protein LOC127317894 [Lolium perenne]